MAFDHVEAPRSELRYIKTLCLAKHYRQCIRACRKLLEATQASPSHTKLFCNFYLGLGHDEIARLMLELSPAKIPCFDQAERFYAEALCALPAIDEQIRLGTVTPRVEHDPFFEGPAAAASTRTPEQIAHDSYYKFASPSPSPRGQLRDRNLSIQSSQSVSRDTSGSDLTDVESHSSFDQIVTPTKLAGCNLRRSATPEEPLRQTIDLPSNSTSHAVLERELSTLSLLEDSPPRKPSGLPRTTSTISDIRQLHRTEDINDQQQLLSPPRQISRPRSEQQRLLRPIRMGSPAKAYQLPARLSQLSGNTLGTSSTLPKLKTEDLHRKTWPALPNDSRNMTPTFSEDSPVSPVSPVSPLGYEGDLSEVTTTSPVSPATPERHFSPDEALRLVAEESEKKEEEVEEEEVDQQPVASHHVEAMERQIRRHIAMLDIIKRQTLAVQAARAAERPKSLTSLAPLSRPGSSSSSNHDSVMSAENKRFMPRSKSLRMEQEKDTPEQRRKRLEAGRARRWERPRFDAQRYVDLADQALAEL
ncbi:hypothetical protein EJ03DRAFT_332489 [Teratosphaeria nubilosa]|uniref:Uncharacterized protein n=1 Tax=Teratosphaeria nubilosa TaxID=161662 RepID=A0A6G1KSY9_9PEZI|nr:hypothetical protein EJ03DRAFT_332489 [Teratosphaeria nubilosa]